MRGVKSVEPVAALRSAPDKARFGQDSQVLRHLGLGHREGADECPDSLFAPNQLVQDRATVRPGNGVEDIGRRVREGHAT